LRTSERFYKKSSNREKNVQYFTSLTATPGREDPYGITIRAEDSYFDIKMTKIDIVKLHKQFSIWLQDVNTVKEVRESAIK
jgi:hypothetical protein